MASGSMRTGPSSTARVEGGLHEFTGGPSLPSLSRPLSRNPRRCLFSIICNARPFTYFGRFPVDACPQASLDKGLDFLGLKTLHALTIPRVVWSVFISRSHMRWKNTCYYPDVDSGSLRATQADARPGRRRLHRRDGSGRRAADPELARSPRLGNRPPSRVAYPCAAVDGQMPTQGSDLRRPRRDPGPRAAPRSQRPEHGAPASISTGPMSRVLIALTIPGCPLKDYFHNVIPAKLKEAFPAIRNVAVDLTSMTEEERAVAHRWSS